MQARLAQRGYDVGGPPDGDIGTKSKAAIADFEQKSGARGQRTGFGQGAHGAEEIGRLVGRRGQNNGAGSRWDGPRRPDGADHGCGLYLCDFGPPGSVIGGLTATLTTWLGQRSQAKAGQIAHDLARREDLVRDFILAASKTYGDAIVNNEAKMPEFIDLYAMVSRMRVLAMPRAVACAEVVMGSILETSSARIERSPTCANS